MYQRQEVPLQAVDSKQTFWQSRGQILGKPNPKYQDHLTNLKQQNQPQKPTWQQKTPTQTHHIKQNTCMQILTKQIRQTTPQQPTSLLHIGIRKEERERRKEGVKGQ
jgi:hypothetical protein